MKRVVCRGEVEEVLEIGKKNMDVRSSHSQMFFKIGVLKNFAKFAGKHLLQSLFLNKVGGPRPEL